MTSKDDKFFEGRVMCNKGFGSSPKRIIGDVLSYIEQSGKIPLKRPPLTEDPNEVRK